MRGGAVWQLVGLITRRSQVQILPPLPGQQNALAFWTHEVRPEGVRIDLREIRIYPAPATKQKGRAPTGSGFLFSRAGMEPEEKQVQAEAPRRGSAGQQAPRPTERRSREGHPAPATRKPKARPCAGLSRSGFRRFWRWLDVSPINLETPPHEITRKAERIDKTVCQHERPEVAFVEQEKSAEN